MHYQECTDCGARYLMGTSGGTCSKCGGLLKTILPTIA